MRQMCCQGHVSCHSRAVWRRRSGLSSIYMIRMGLTTSCNECPVPVFSSICFLRIRFRWIQLRGVPTSTDDGRNFPLLRFPNAIVFPSIYLFRIWLQIGPDARKNAKQADDGMQRMSRSGLFFHLLFANSVQMGSDTRSPRPQRRNVRFVYVEEIEALGDKVDGPIWAEDCKKLPL